MRHIVPPYYERINNLDQYQDFFDRADFRENLTRLFSNTDDSLVLTLNADWGEGKTTFIKFWEEQLVNSTEFIPIYYDAFKNDFTSDTFISLAVTIQMALMKHSIANSCEFDEYKETAIELGLELAKMTASNAISISSGGLLAADSFMDWMSGEYKKRREEHKKIELRGSKEFVESKYDAFFEKQTLIENYQRKLKALLESDRNNPKKIIFFIDELDRCRPSFAIEVIEKIKHLFSVEHVNFVLAINRDQLVEILTSAYGVNEDDAFIYLQKFVHVETTLPTLKMKINVGDREKIKRFISDLVDAFEIPENYSEIEIITELMMKLISRINMTPRSIERIFTLYTISISSVNPEQTDRLWKQILLLSAFKAEIPSYFDRIKNAGHISNPRSGDEINLGNIVEWLVNSYFESSEVSVLASKTPKQAQVSGLDEAIRIVDIYELPKSYKKVKDEAYGDDSVGIKG